MKATKILIAAIMILVTTTTFGQVKNGLFAMVKYFPEMNRYETWVADMHERISPQDYGESDLPVISTTFYVDYADISYENHKEESSFEEGPNLEPWMKEPFEMEELQEELKLEDWMSTPFETMEPLPIEEWMTASNW